MFNKILSFSFFVSLSLSSVLYAGSGVLPMFDDGTVLLGAKPHGANKFWLDFGGPSGPTYHQKRQAAARYGNEKTARTIPIQIHHLNGAPSVEIGQDRMFFIRLHGTKPSTAELIHKGGGTDYKYVDAQLLLTAALGDRLLPGTNEPMHPRFIARIRKDANQLGGGALRALIRSPKGAAPIRPFVVPPVPVPVTVVTPPIAAPAAAPASKPSRRAMRAARRASRRKSVSQSRRIRRQRYAPRLRHVRQQRRMSRKSHIRKKRGVSRRSRHISRRRRSR